MIQMTEEAGLLPRLDTLAARFPAFTLLGDGTLIYHLRTGYYQTHLDEAALQAAAHPGDHRSALLRPGPPVRPAQYL